MSRCFFHSWMLIWRTPWPTRRTPTSETTPTTGSPRPGMPCSIMWVHPKYTHQGLVRPAVSCEYTQNTHTEVWYALPYHVSTPKIHTPRPGTPCSIMWVHPKYTHRGLVRPAVSCEYTQNTHTKAWYALQYHVSTPKIHTPRLGTPCSIMWVHPKYTHQGLVRPAVSCEYTQNTHSKAWYALQYHVSTPKIHIARPGTPCSIMWVHSKYTHQGLVHPAVSCEITPNTHTKAWYALQFHVSTPKIHILRPGTPCSIMWVHPKYTHQGLVHPAVSCEYTPNTHTKVWYTLQYHVSTPKIHTPRPGTPCSIMWVHPKYTYQGLVHPAVSCEYTPNTHTKAWYAQQFHVSTPKIHILRPGTPCSIMWVHPKYAYQGLVRPAVSCEYTRNMHT